MLNQKYEIKGDESCLFHIGLVMRGLEFVMGLTPNTKEQRPCNCGRASPAL